MSDQQIFILEVVGPILVLFVAGIIFHQKPVTYVKPKPPPSLLSRAQMAQFSSFLACILIPTRVDCQGEGHAQKNYNSYLPRFVCFKPIFFQNNVL